MLDRLTAADFSPLVGAAFASDPPHGDVTFELTEVTPLREPPARPGQPAPRRPFSVLFRARTADHLPQGLFALSHDRLGRLEVFLVPVGREADGLLLEAVFA